MTVSLTTRNDILQAAIEEGVVVGGGCTLLRLSLKIDEIKEQLDNEEQQVQNAAFTFPVPMFIFTIGKLLFLVYYVE